MEISEQALSRMMADAVARISRDAQGPSVSRMEATVVSVASDGSMTLNRGTPERPQMLYGVRSLTSAAGAAPGDIAVVETFDHVSYVIGIVARKSGTAYVATTLYDNASGTKANLTLSESAADFEYIVVFFADDADVISSVSVPSPDGHDFGCLATHGAGSGNSSETGVIASAIYHVSATNVSKKGWFRFYDSSGVISDRYNTIKIYRIVGYR